MTKRSIILGAVAALMIGLAAYALSAQPIDKGSQGEWSPDWDHSRRLETVAQYLDLDASQTDRWIQIIDDQQARRVLRRDQIIELRARFKTLADQDSPSLEALGQTALDIYDELETFRLERGQIQAELESILTPEQQERFEAVQAARGLFGPKHHSRSGPPRFDPGDE